MLFLPIDCVLTMDGIHTGGDAVHGLGAEAPARRHIQVGAWVVEAERNALSRGAETILVEPKAMDVLMLLAERVDRVVGRDELLAAAWPGVVVGDEALTQCIIKLRRALGDDSRSPAYIETISKRGYRLIASVRPIASPSAPTGLEQPRPPDGPASPRRRTRWVGWLVAASLAVVAASVYYLQRPVFASAELDALATSDAMQPGGVAVSIAPFESLGAEQDQAYLARGISDDLMTDLSRLSGLRVIRESATAAADSPSADARYRISGSVQRDAETLRVNVYLVDARTNEQVWAGRFERPFEDLFAVQDKIINHIVDLIAGTVSTVERARIARRYTPSLEAYDAFLRGQALFLVRRSEENEQARAYFRKAVELDPKFARAYASLAMTYAMEYRLRGSGATSLALDRALELAETARQIDPEIPQVHWALGFVHAQSRHHEQAIESLKTAIKLDRSFADAYALLGGIYTYTGHPEQSIPLLRTAMRLNPGAGHLYFLLLGRAYLFENDIDQALINLRAALVRDPVDVETHVYLVAALAAAGNRLGTQWEVEEVRGLQPGFSAARWLNTYPMTSASQKKRLQGLLVEAGL